MALLLPATWGRISGTRPITKKYIGKQKNEDNIDFLICDGVAGVVLN